jgi:hypothetical protein
VRFHLLDQAENMPSCVISQWLNFEALRNGPGAHCEPGDVKTRISSEPETSTKLICRFAE